MNLELITFIKQPNQARLNQRRSRNWLGIPGRWLTLGLLAWVTCAARAQTTAQATATVINGFVVAYTVTNGGSGYAAAPVVTVMGGGGTGATAVAVVSNGMVTQINPVSPGSGYTSTPTVVIAAPVGVTLLSLQMVPMVTINGQTGDTDQIESSDSLGADAVWVPLATVVLTNTVQEWCDSVSQPGAFRRFYQAVRLGPGGWPTPGLRFVWLPGGQFLMGSPADEVDRQADEGPQTLVTLTQGFFLGRYEVTQGEYLSVIGSNPSYFTGDTNRPVEQVSWQDATNYCAHLTAQQLAAGRLPSGWAYRLPTEAEWEYACRAGSTTRFYYGNDPGYTQLSNYCWYEVDSSGTSHEDGEKQPNAWGLYDMSGNVWEYCADWYGSYAGGSVTDPKGPPTGTCRVCRGGSWDYIALRCRSAFRNSWTTPTYSDSHMGFRVVLAKSP